MSAELQTREGRDAELSENAGLSAVAERECAGLSAVAEQENAGASAAAERECAGLSAVAEREYAGLSAVAERECAGLSADAEQEHAGASAAAAGKANPHPRPGADLLRAAQSGDRDALDRTVRENSGLIWSIVKRYAGRGVEPDDLYQLGCMGFLKAVRGFDFSYGTCFSTYAVPKIAGEIRRYLRDNAPVKIGRTMREAAFALCRLREKLRHELGREPALSELSAEAGLSPEEIARLELSGEPPESLQQETADGLPLESLLGTEAPEDAIVERLALRDAVEALPEKERLAILYRYFRGLTQDQTARLLRVSQVQVSRLERRGIDRLRRTLGV